MQAFDAESFAGVLALISVVVLLAALLSGLIERSGLPQVAVFLALGAVLGPAGIGVIDLSLRSPALPVIAILSLLLVLFTDAVSLDTTEVRSHAGLVLLVLGPGTLLAAALTALAGWGLLGLSPAAAAVLGASLASTDPVLLRGLMRHPGLPRAARDILGLESGMNDVVLLPIVLVAMALLGREGLRGAADWTRFGLDLFILGPGAGIVVGLLAVVALDVVRRRIGVRRDYESLYALGVAFAAYAAAEAVHGSGFLAAFAAGLTIAAFDIELCDCFLDYGQATAEMFLLLTFVAFGGSLIWSGLTLVSGPVLLFAAIALLVRPAVLLAALAGTRLEARSRFLVVWFGPRGLSSLLLVLLPVFAGLPESESLFQIASLVVLLSILLHGGSLMLAGRRLETPPAPEPAPAEPGPERISVEGLHRLREAGEPLTVLDVRTERSYRQSQTRARGAVRLHPDRAARHAAELGLAKGAWLVAYCA